MRSIKVTCLVLLAGLTCLGLALVAAAPGQPAPATQPSAVSGSGSSVPAPPSAEATPAAAASDARASIRPAAPATPAVEAAAQPDQAIRAYRQAQQAADLGGEEIYEAGPYGSRRYVQMGALAADPELAKWMEEARKAEAEQGQLLAKYAQTTDEKQRADIKASLAKVLQRQFDLQLQQREREVSQIEARVKKLREMIEKRNGARQTIVTGRLDQLVNEADGMGWVAPSGPTSPGSSYYYSGAPARESSSGAGVGSPGTRSSGRPQAAPAPLAVPAARAAGAASDAGTGASGPQKPASKY